MQLPLPSGRLFLSPLGEARTPEAIEVSLGALCYCKADCAFVVQERMEAQQVRIFELQYEQHQQKVVERNLLSMRRDSVSLSPQLHHRDGAVQALKAQLADSRAAINAAETRYLLPVFSKLARSLCCIALCEVAAPPGLNTCVLIVSGDLYGNVTAFSSTMRFSGQCATGVQSWREGCRSQRHMPSSRQ